MEKTKTENKLVSNRHTNDELLMTKITAWSHQAPLQRKILEGSSPKYWGSERQAPKAGESSAEWGGLWRRVSFSSRPQVWRACWAPPAGSSMKPRLKTYFGIFWRLQTAPFLHLYADALSSTVFHVTFGGQGRDLGAIAPYPNIESRLKVSLECYVIQYDCR